MPAYWLKLYTEALHDPKVAALPDSSFRRFIECLMLAREVGEWGYLPDLQYMSWTLRLTIETLEQDLSRLALAGLLELREDDGTERWYVTNFQRRQEPSPNAKRQSKWRENQKQKAETETESINRIHKHKRYVTNNVTDNVISNAPDTHTYIHPDPEPIAQLITAMSEVSKTSHAAAEDLYNAGAYELTGNDITPDMVREFADWWKDNGHYPGKPALKSLLEEIKNMKTESAPKTLTIPDDIVILDDSMFGEIKS